MATTAYRIVLAELATGVVLNPDGSRHLSTSGPTWEPAFESLDEALAAKDDLLARFPFAEVNVRGGPPGFQSLRFVAQGSDIVVELSGVRVTTTMIEELDHDGTPLVSISREEIKALRIEHGYIAERPLRAIFGGICLALVGLSMGVALLHNLLGPDEFVGRRVAYLLASCATASMLGVWLTSHALRTGTFVAATLRSDRRKLAFRDRVAPADAAQFTQALQRSSPWSHIVQ